MVRFALRCSLWCALALPAVAHARPVVELSPEQVVLGRDSAVQVRVIREEPGRQLLSAASAGTLLPGAAPNEFIWTPPDLRYPAQAVLLFWEAGTGAPDPAVVVLPLYGRTTVEVDTEPGALVRIRVGDELFGPEKANPRGKVKVSIVVPPGVKSVQAIANTEGQQTTRTVPLKVPPVSAFTALIGPQPLPPKSGGWVVVGHDEAVPRAQLRVKVESGTATEALTTSEFTAFRVRPEPSLAGAQLSAQVTTSPEEDDPAALRLQVAVAGGEVAPEPPPAVVRRSVAQVLLGGYLGSGANVGLQLEAAAARPLPFLEGRIAVEGALGVRRQATHRDLTDLGRLDSELWAVPITVGLRGRLFERGAAALDARAGAGPVLFAHAVTAGFQPPVTESGMGFDAFAALDGTWRLESVDLVAELRADLITARTQRLVARPGGLSLAVGAQWELPW